MTQQHPMPPARRRPIPGMTAPVPTPPPPSRDHDPESPSMTAATPTSAPVAKPPRSASGRSSAPTAGRARGTKSAANNGRPERRPAADYGSTRLVNFRIPVDLHDRYRDLVRDAEQRHPRLRRPSLTELVIALLEEGPATADEVAEVIRRKRAAEHETERC
jgi:hypothetical protein